jgi:putative addiction module component (TIGR02574 family)
MKISAADTLSLPISERIQLVRGVWKSVAECPDQIEPTDATRQLVRERLAAHRANPAKGSPWEVDKGIFG